MNKDL